MILIFREFHFFSRAKRGTSSSIHACAYQTLLKYPHKSEKIETITCDHQTSYENFVCRVNEEFINMFNNNETEVHIPLHRALRVTM